MKKYSFLLGVLLCLTAVNAFAQREGRDKCIAFNDTIYYISSNSNSRAKTDYLLSQYSTIDMKKGEWGKDNLKISYYYGDLKLVKNVYEMVRDQYNEMAKYHSGQNIFTLGRVTPETTRAVVWYTTKPSEDGTFFVNIFLVTPRTQSEFSWMFYRGEGFDDFDVEAMAKAVNRWNPPANPPQEHFAAELGQQKQSGGIVTEQLERHLRNRPHIAECSN